MKAKDELMKIRLYKRRIRSLELELERLRDELEEVRSTWPDGQPHGTGTSDPVGSKAGVIEKIEECEAEIRDARARAYIEQARLVMSIDRVKDPELNELLTLRYIEGRRWEEIAVEMGYSYRHTHRRHGDALREYERRMDGRS